MTHLFMLSRYQWDRLMANCTECGIESVGILRAIGRGANLYG